MSDTGLSDTLARLRAGLRAHAEGDVDGAERLIGGGSASDRRAEPGTAGSGLAAADVGSGLAAADVGRDLATADVRPQGASAGPAPAAFVDGAAAGWDGPGWAEGSGSARGEPAAASRWLDAPEWDGAPEWALPDPATPAPPTPAPSANRPGGTAGDDSDALRSRGRGAAGTRGPARRRTGRGDGAGIRDENRDATPPASGDSRGSGAGRRAGRRHASRAPGGSGSRGPRPEAAAATGRPAVDEVEEAARAIALRKLNHSARSRRQLEEAMRAEGVAEEVAARVLDRFEQVGLVDDAQYAAMLVRTRHGERGLARRGLVQELRRKGIGEADAQAALEQVTPEDEDAAARDLVRRKGRSSAGLDPEKRRRRLFGMLARKGYPPGTALRVVDEYLAEQG